MPITPPNLDDRNFNQLVADARQFIKERAQGWTDMTESDPGVVLVELFAFLTDTMLYRLNRIPIKAYCEFLRLIGVRLYPPAAAAVVLRFTRSRPGEAAVVIPQGTRATLQRSDPAAPLFTTIEPATIAAGATSVDVRALDCESVEAELLGTGGGVAGLSLSVTRPPIVAPTGLGPDLVVGVEADDEELKERVPALPYGGKTFRIWREVDSFATSGPADPVYIADRLEGTVTFAPAVRLAGSDGQLSMPSGALGAVPKAGREIRAWYRRGGGAQGNVGPGTLTVLKDPITGVDVTNPEAATGGRDGETLDNAILRGPQDLHSLNRAVTASDFELIAEQLGVVARARALTRSELWTFATAGTVEVVLVPQVPDAQRISGRVTPEALHAQETEAARARVQATLEERRPLGTTCLVSWANYKTVTVKMRLHVLREEDAAGVRDRLLASLAQAISPLPPPPTQAALEASGALAPGGWGFGQPLRVSDAYYIAQREPAVRWVESLRLVLDQVPDQNVTSLAADGFQPSMWYAAADSLLYTSRNDGGGWEPSGKFADETVLTVCPSAEQAGLVAAATELKDSGGFRVYVSSDCGQSWRTVGLLDAKSRIYNLAWTTRDSVPILLLTTDTGLYEISPGGSPIQVLVDVHNAARPLYAVTSGVVQGTSCVAVSAQGSGGVFLSKDAGRTNTFRSIGLSDDIRVLAVQREGPRGFLWAGVTVEGTTDPGKGAYTWELPEAPEGWLEHSKGWTAGSCHSIAFTSGQALAASHRGGVLRLASRSADAEWQQPDVNCGLPLRDPGRFQPVDAVAAPADGHLVMAGGVKGISRSMDAVSWEPGAISEYIAGQGDVTIPPTWLLCSGEHEVEVVSDESH